MLTKEQVEKINSYYDVIIEHSEVMTFPELFIKDKSEDKDKARILFKTFLTFGDSTINKANIKEHLKNGTAIEITRKDMIVAYTDMTDDEYETKYTNTDKRTRDYLDAIIKNTGYIRATNGDGADDKYERITVSDKDLDIRKIEDGMYAIYEGDFVPPDDYCEVLWIFNKIPTRADLKMVKIVEHTRECFQVGAYRESFECWECGLITKHWLDLEGTFVDKLDMLEDKYCGC